MKNVMIDIETLSTADNAAVIAIGACTFDASGFGDPFEIQIDPRLSPGDRNRDTYHWWKGQDRAVFDRMMGGRTTPWAAVSDFREWLEPHKRCCVWANPPQFDIVILRNFFATCGEEWPMHWRNERDVRTILRLADDNGIRYHDAYEETTAHDALSDARAQARAVRIALSEMSLW